MADRQRRMAVPMGSQQLSTPAMGTSVDAATSFPERQSIARRLTTSRSSCLHPPRRNIARYTRPALEVRDADRSGPLDIGVLDPAELGHAIALERDLADDGI